MGIVSEQIQKLIKVREEEIERLRAELDRVDANDADAQVRIKQQISDLMERLRELERLDPAPSEDARKRQSMERLVEDFRGFVTTSMSEAQLHQSDDQLLALRDAMTAFVEMCRAEG